MMSDHFIFSVSQVRLGSFEGPGKFSVRSGLAGVNLRSLGVGEQDWLLSGGKCDRGRKGLVMRAIVATRILVGKSGEEAHESCGREVGGEESGRFESSN